MQFYEIMSESEVDRLHAAVLRVLAEKGVRIEHRPVMERLAALGAHADFEAHIVRFPADWVERFIAESAPFDWAGLRPEVTAHAGMYEPTYLDPEDDEHKPFTLERVRAYVKLAAALDPPVRCSMQGNVLAGATGPTAPLTGRILGWKWGFTSTGSVNDPRLAPALVDMCEAVAAERGGQPQAYYSGYVNLISPLTLRRHQAEEFHFFASQGYPINVGSMVSMGGSGPVTAPGAVVLRTAESLICNAIKRAYGRGGPLFMACSVGPLDMTTAIWPPGRPESALANVLMAQLAHRYDAQFVGQSGTTNAKRPDAEAAAAKALTAIPTLLVCGRAHVNCGHLSAGELHSPVQMALDHEFVQALRCVARGIRVDDDSIALDDLLAVDHGGHFTDRDHTVAHLRTDLWHPSLWSRTNLRAWTRDGARTTIDNARQRVRDLLAGHDPEPQLSPDAEHRLLAMVDRAGEAL